MSLQVKGISFGYPGEKNKVIENFSSAFSSDKITGLVGPNGSGKTTLARIIMGILRPEEGMILLDGKDLATDTLAQRGKKLGYVMQNPARQIFSATVEEEMEYGLRNLGLPEEEISRRREKYLDYFQISHHRKSFPYTLSHGEKQRLVLAAILAMEPSYLILDEPTASLDRQRSALLGKYLAGLSSGIIVISHDEGFVEEYCHKVVVMGGSNG
ncbi:MAG: energy-coupling factor ABC transporter ATP-binding protein [Anaerovoracaceae bacterium]|jgi:energy-coupling factor transport system ATP-binding protein